MDFENNINTLKLKKSMLLSEIESLSEVNDSMLVQLGKLVVKIADLDKKRIRETENLIV